MFPGDLRDPAVSERALAGMGAVIHTANTLDPPAGMAPDTFHEIDVTGTFHLLQAAGRHAGHLERLVHISSDSVYPMGTHSSVPPCYQPIDELHHPQNAAAIRDLHARAAGDDQSAPFTRRLPPTTLAATWQPHDSQQEDHDGHGYDGRTRVVSRARRARHP